MYLCWCCAQACLWCCCAARTWGLVSDTFPPSPLLPQVTWPEYVWEWLEHVNDWRLLKLRHLVPAPALDTTPAPAAGAAPAGGATTAPGSGAGGSRGTWEVPQQELMYQLPLEAAQPPPVRAADAPPRPPASGPAHRQHDPRKDYHPLNRMDLLEALDAAAAAADAAMAAQQPAAGGAVAGPVAPPPGNKKGKGGGGEAHACAWARSNECLARLISLGAGLLCCWCLGRGGLASAHEHPWTSQSCVDGRSVHTRIPPS